MSKNILSILGSARVAKPSYKGESRISDPFADWRVVGSHSVRFIHPRFNLKDLVGVNNSVKVAAFDLDDTLISTKSGSRFARGSSDWKWKSDKVVPRLVSLISEKYLVVIFTNQGGVISRKENKSFQNFTNKLNMVIASLTEAVDNSPHSNNAYCWLFCAPKRPKAVKGHVASDEESHLYFRKPQIGMWEAMKAELDGIDVEMGKSFYIGDAAGGKGDFSDSDKMFAENIGLQFYTPNQFFQ